MFRVAVTHIEKHNAPANVHKPCTALKNFLPLKTPCYKVKKLFRIIN
jgi:hypothetical protein